MTRLTTLQQTRFAGIPAEGPFQVDLLVRVQAPAGAAEAAAPRPPLHLAVVLDRSGSMGGEPLRQACRCAAAILDRMGPQDRLAIITYDNRARVLRPCTPVSDPEAIRLALAGVQAGGCTDLHLGWTTGIRELRRAHQGEAISRVLLLSDGQANEGIVAPEELAAACALAQAEGFSTSTYGLGSDFGEGVMTAMAKHGQGRSYYGETAEDLLDPFMEEFDLLSNLVARKLTVSFDTQQAFTLTQMNGYPVLESGQWALPDLAYKSEAWALFRIQGTTAGKPGGTLDLGQIKVTWHDTKGKPADALMATFSLPLLSEGDAIALPKDSLVASRMSELRIGKLQELAWHAAAANDWDLVRTYLDEMKALAAEHPWSKAVVDELASLMESQEYHSLTKEFRYGSKATSDRLTDVDEDLLRPSTSSYTRRKPRQGKPMPRPEQEPPKDVE